MTTSGLATYVSVTYNGEHNKLSYYNAPQSKTYVMSLAFIVLFYFVLFSPPYAAKSNFLCLEERIYFCGIIDSSGWSYIWIWRESQTAIS